jgi:hypothetical protein
VATPKVFISSTCFDLSEVREQLKRFVRSFGFEPILSEHGDVFYHPDLHTHEACVHEVSNCQLFILIIGGRFGGTYTLDKSKSITNAEYEAARTANIPVFAYVRNGVLSNHHIFRENRGKKFVNEISYPAIDKQTDAENIFNFIDSVRKSPINNAFEGFDNFNEIESHLRKQWAGMFFEFLKTREIKTQIDATNHLLNNLEGANSKLEQLVKSLYLSTSPDTSKAKKTISDIDAYSNSKKFFSEIFRYVSEYVGVNVNSEEPFLGGFDLIELSKISPDKLTWDEYLVETKLFIRDEVSSEYKTNIIYFHTRDFGFSIGEGDGYYKDMILAYNNGVLRSSQKQRLEILSEYIN